MGSNCKIVALCSVNAVLSRWRMTGKWHVVRVSLLLWLICSQSGRQPRMQTERENILTHDMEQTNKHPPKLLQPSLRHPRKFIWRLVASRKLLTNARIWIGLLSQFLNMHRLIAQYWSTQKLSFTTTKHWNSTRCSSLTQEVKKAEQIDVVHQAS